MRAKVPTTNENKTYAPIPAGTHLARCVSIVDLGTQITEYEGKSKTDRKVRFTWETPNETQVFKEENGEQPFLVSRVLTLSLHSKATMRKTIESWLGRKLTAREEAEGYDLSQLLGKECIVNIVHKEVGDKVYANVDSISPVMKGMVCPKQITDSIFFSLEEGEYQPMTFEGFGDWLKEIIMKSPEYAQVSKNDPKSPVENLKQDEEDEIDLDEINFNTV